jgi:hypothetical protein
MKKLRDFLCANCGTFERFVPDTKLSVICKCGSEADRLVSAPKVKGNTTGGSPSFSKNSYS